MIKSVKFDYLLGYGSLDCSVEQLHFSSAFAMVCWPFPPAVYLRILHALLDDDGDATIINLITLTRTNLLSYLPLLSLKYSLSENKTSHT